jgi:lipopolysaccharide/colanic/teichoic acid biosynthesis glycosyltransferase
LKPSPSEKKPVSNGQKVNDLSVSVKCFAPWQKIIKRVSDIILSFFTLVITFPVFLTLAILIKVNSKGPVIFRQERIGLYGKPFTLLKFRTMKEDAEPDGPMLSNPNDPRVTTIGIYMRKHKLDEIPNFLNVFWGEMSIVGPRPERQFYLDLLRKENPEADLLLNVKPGITCTGQIVYGYATDIKEMVERLDYELEYVKAPSLRKDALIMWQTMLLLIRGRKE